MNTPRNHLEWLVERRLTRLERWMHRRSVRITLTVLAFFSMALVLMTAPVWGEWVDAVELVCN